jgi:hypothetical protein
MPKGSKTDAHMLDGVRLEPVKAGDKIMANGTHKCLRPGQVCVVYADDGQRENMYIACDSPEPRHYLTKDAKGDLVGFQKMRRQ